MFLNQVKFLYKLYHKDNYRLEDEKICHFSIER